MVVPSEATVGDTVRMSCQYEAKKKEPLYMIKWYHNDSEFYRYSFHEWPRAEMIHHYNPNKNNNNKQHQNQLLHQSSSSSSSQPPPQDILLDVSVDYFNFFLLI